MLILGFFAVALAYALVGFGGGSSYLALLTLSGVDYQLLPTVALLCNLIVVSGGCYHYLRGGHLEARLLWPFTITSIPCAYLGARITLDKQTFFILLGLSLLAAGLRLLVAPPKDQLREVRLAWALPLGAALGLISGLVGIGGGIFLSPVLLNLRWGQPRQVAAAASGFIWLNSVASLIGHLTKPTALHELSSFTPLFAAVLVGGQIGSRLSAGHAPVTWLRALTGAFTLFVGVRVVLLSIH